MAEILTQNEIDQLLRDLNDGTAVINSEAPQVGPRIKKYDFRTANKIPRDQIKTLGIIYENFARLLATYLTGTLGVFCEANVSSLEEQTYQEFTNSTPQASLLAILKMEPLLGSTLFQISPDIAYAILECLLGGPGTPSDRRRLFTEIDLVILEKVIRQLLPLMNEAWDKITKVDTVLENLETSLQFAQIVPPNETIVIITINTRVGGVESLVNLCLPQIAFEPVTKNLNTRLLNNVRGERHKTESYQDTILEMIRITPVPIKAILSEATVTVHELMNLQVGDVIQLDNKLTDHLLLKIGHIPRLEGVLGTKGNRYAIRVTGINFKEETLYE